MIPFMQSSIAQEIIQNKLVERNTPTSINSAGMYRNPIYDTRTIQEQAGELDPSARFPNSIINTFNETRANEASTEVPNCDQLYPGEGRVYDPVLKACVLPEVATDEANTSDGNQDQPTKDELNYLRMSKDLTQPFGASNFLEDYVTQGLGEGTFLKFDPTTNRFGEGVLNPFLNVGLGAIDTLFGMPYLRENQYNKALQTYTDLGYGQSVGDNLYHIYTPNQYYKSVANNMTTVDGGQTMTNAEAIDSVMNPAPMVYDPLTGTSRPSNKDRSGSPIAEDLTGSLLGTQPITSVDSQGNRSRNDDVYRSNVAKNIERNKRNFGYSRFKPGVGFTGGR